MFIFFGTHLTPGVFGRRQALVARLGEKKFTGLYIACSVLGMVGMIAGKATAPFIHLYFPPLWSRPATGALMFLSMICLATFFLPGNFRRITRHPMLWSITLWSAGHLLANGDLASVLVFGGFGTFSLISMWSLNARGAQLSTNRYSLTRDIAVILLGGLIYGMIVLLHPYLFGVPASL